MKYQNWKHLLECIAKDGEFESNEIKKKRIVKEIEHLQLYEHPHLSFEDISTDLIGILITILIKRPHSKPMLFKLYITYEYPFARPQLLYPNQGHELGAGKDLLDSILGGKIWGPSIMVHSLLNHILELPDRMHNAGLCKWKYHSMTRYSLSELKQQGMKLFRANQHTWKYLIKSTAKKILGFAPNAFLVFTEVDEHLIHLQRWCEISSITEANASLSDNRYQLEMQFEKEIKWETMHFAGPAADIQVILGMLNPIEMIERDFESRDKILSAQEEIQRYSSLVEHYSLKDKGKAERYMKLMKEAIQKQYEFENPLGKEEDNSRLPLKEKEDREQTEQVANGTKEQPRVKTIHVEERREDQDEEKTELSNGQVEEKREEKKEQQEEQDKQDKQEDMPVEKEEQELQERKEQNIEKDKQEQAEKQQQISQKSEQNEKLSQKSDQKPTD